jgi:hypothetical protein
MNPQPPRKGLSSQFTAHRLTDPRVHSQFLSHNSHWSSGEKPSFSSQQATRLTRRISPACNQYIQYSLVDANPSILNRHIQLMVPAFHNALSALSNWWSSAFCLRAPSGLQLTILHKKLSKHKCMETYCHHVVFWPHGHLLLPTPTPSRYYHLVSSSMNDKEWIENKPECI